MTDHPSGGPGEKYGTPPQYAGPDVPTQAPLVNPSAGEQGRAGFGSTPAAAPIRPGTVPTGPYDQAPQDTSKG